MITTAGPAAIPAKYGAILSLTARCSHGELLSKCLISTTDIVLRAGFDRFITFKSRWLVVGLGESGCISPETDFPTR